MAMDWEVFSFPYSDRLEDVLSVAYKVHKAILASSSRIRRQMRESGSGGAKLAYT